MKHLKKLGLAAGVAISMMAIIGASTASATTIGVGGIPQNNSVEISASLEAGSSAILKDSFGTTTDTCTESNVGGKTESPFTGATVGGKVSTLTFGKCSHTTTVLANGSLSVSHISGTNNGTVSSSGAEVTVLSTAFGASAVCKTGAGTTIGTLTAATSLTNPGVHATIDVNGKISCGILGTATWTGSYWVTKPTDVKIYA